MTKNATFATFSHLSGTFSEIFIDPAKGHVLQAGDLMKRLKLAETLEVVARENADAIYNGSLTQSLLKDIYEVGGIITAKDLANYDVQWQRPVEAHINKYKMFSVPIPGSGVLLSFMLNILDGFIPGKDNGTTYQRVVEAFKYGYGKRTELGDISQDQFVPNITYVEEVIRCSDDGFERNATTILRMRLK